MCPSCNWKGGDKTVEDVLYDPARIEKVYATGGEASMRHIRNTFALGSTSSPPTRSSSATFIGRGALQSENDLRDVAGRLALDVGVFNQEACVNARVVYVESGTDSDGVELLRRLGRLVYEAITDLPVELSSPVEHFDPELRDAMIPFASPTSGTTSRRARQRGGPWCLAPRRSGRLQPHAVPEASVTLSPSTPSTTPCASSPTTRRRSVCIRRRPRRCSVTGWRSTAGDRTSRSATPPTPASPLRSTGSSHCAVCASGSSTKTPEMLTDEKILVTGCEARIGDPLAAFLARDNEVWGAPDSVIRPSDEIESAGVRGHALDFAKPDLEDLPDDFSYVIHLAARTGSDEDYDEAISVNAEGTGLLLAHCRRAKAALVMSTVSVYKLRARRPAARLCRDGSIGGREPAGIHGLPRSPRSRRRPSPASAPRVRRPGGHRPDEQRVRRPRRHTDQAPRAVVGGQAVVARWDPLYFSPIHEHDISTQFAAMLGAAACRPTSSTGAATRP